MSDFKNFTQYEQFTKAGDWQAICRLNNVNLEVLGARKELKVLSRYLEPGEVVFALTSGNMNQTLTSNSSDFGINTWLVVLTNERFLFLDCAMLSNSVDTQSIRHDRVQAVSASQGWVLGKIMVDLGARVVTIDNCQKATIAPIADLANKWLRHCEQRTQNSVKPAPDLVMDRLERLAALHATGGLTAEEFTLAKRKLLAAD